MERRQTVPVEFQDAHLLHVTGWPPDVLDATPTDRLEKFLLYQAVRRVAEEGGELNF